MTEQATSAGVSLNPSDWTIIKSFTHGKLTLSPGREAIPADISESRFLELATRGYIKPKQGVNPFLAPEAMPSIQGFLAGTDVHVIRAIRKFQPTREVVEEILRLAKLGGRRLELIEALELYLGIPYSPTPPPLRPQP